VPPRYCDYLQFSGFVREIYAEYTDRIESFGIDENWIDLTGSVPSFAQGEKVVHEIREKVKKQLGLTVSIGLADNKVFAKLGSDMKKPDACTIIPKDKYKEIVWPLPVGYLLYVGRATEVKLRGRYIETIGDLAKTDPDNLKRWLGKVGLVLHMFANGEDKSHVAPSDFQSPIKSVGNSHTCPRDLESDQDVRIMIYAMAESVGARLMEYNLNATTVEFSYVNTDLSAYAVRQMKLDTPTCISGEIAKAAYKLFKQHYGHWPRPLRKIGVRGTNLVSMDAPRQLSVYESTEQLIEKEDLERAVNTLRSRYGNKIIQRAVMLTDTGLSSVDAKRDHTIHPLGVFHGGVSTEWGSYTNTIKR
jgi:DNA polymerase-4